MKHSLVSRAVAVALTLTSVGNAWSDGDGRSPEQLGTVSFVTSCEPAVQAQFTRVVASCIHFGSKKTKKSLTRYW